MKYALGSKSFASLDEFVDHVIANPCEIAIGIHEDISVTRLMYLDYLIYESFIPVTKTRSGIIAFIAKNIGTIFGWSHTLEHRLFPRLNCLVNDEGDLEACIDVEYHICDTYNDEYHGLALSVLSKCIANIILHNTDVGLDFPASAKTLLESVGDIIYPVNNRLIPQRPSDVIVEHILKSCRPM